MAIVKQLNLDYKEISLQNLYQKLHRLEQQIKQLSESEPLLVLSTIEGKEILNTKNILRVTSDSNYSRIFLEDGTNIYCSKTLKFIQQQLPATAFMRVHASHLVRLDAIRRIIHQDSKHLILKDGQTIPISRKYASCIEKEFNNPI